MNMNENEEENIKAVGKHEYIIEGSTNLDDLNDSLDLNLESEDYDSLGGFIIESWIVFQKPVTLFPPKTESVWS